jgi:hypothetical protein
MKESYAWKEPGSYASWVHMITNQLYADEQTKNFISHYAHAALKQQKGLSR